MSHKKKKLKKEGRQTKKKKREKLIFRKRLSAKTLMFLQWKSKILKSFFFYNKQFQFGESKVTVFRTSPLDRLRDECRELLVRTKQ